MSGTIYNPIRGLYTKQAFGKSLHKGEDAWLQQPGLTWSPDTDSQGISRLAAAPPPPPLAILPPSWLLAGGCIGYDLFCVFDGHGGKQAASFASKHVLPILQQELAGAILKTDIALPEDLLEYTELSDEDKHAWHMQDTMVQRLPTALVSTFRKVQDQFHANTQVSQGSLSMVHNTLSIAMCAADAYHPQLCTVCSIFMHLLFYLLGV